MEDIEVVARIILRQRATLGTIVVVGLILAAAALLATRHSPWSVSRRAALAASGFAASVLPATTLARPTEGIRWRMPYLADDPLNVLHAGLLSTSPENVLNMAMLVPFGFLAALATRRALAVVFVAVAAVVAVELLQGALGIGVVEAADVVRNVGGAAFGAAVGGLVTWRTTASARIQPG